MNPDSGLDKAAKKAQKRKEQKQRKKERLRQEKMPEPEIIADEDYLVTPRPGASKDVSLKQKNAVPKQQSEVYQRGRDTARKLPWALECMSPR